MAAPTDWPFRPDGKRLYVNDTKQKEIPRVGRRANGDLKNGRLFGKGKARRRTDACVSICRATCIAPARRHLGLGSRRPSLGTICSTNPPLTHLGRCGLSNMYISARSAVYRLKTKAHGFVGGALRRVSR